MPLYDFRCEAGHEFEDFARMDAPCPCCPQCGGMCHKTILRAPAVHGEMMAAEKRLENSTKTHEDGDGIPFRLDGMRETVRLPLDRDRRAKTVVGLLRKFQPETVGDSIRTVKKCTEA